LGKIFRKPQGGFFTHTVHMYTYVVHKNVAINLLARALQALSDPCFSRRVYVSVCLKILMLNISETERFWVSCPIGSL